MIYCIHFSDKINSKIFEICLDHLIIAVFNVWEKK